jgi:hypothetical protein
MHTVDLLQQVLALAKQLGYTVRMEDLGGEGGGICEFGGKRWLFVDLAASTIDQLRRSCDALRLDPQLASVTLTPHVEEVFSTERAA